jgi:hypothetical protein
MPTIYCVGYAYSLSNASALSPTPRTPLQNPRSPYSCSVAGSTVLTFPRHPVHITGACANVIVCFSLFNCIAFWTGNKIILFYSINVKHADVHWLLWSLRNCLLFCHISDLLVKAQILFGQCKQRAEGEGDIKRATAVNSLLDRWKSRETKILTAWAWTAL